MLSRTDLWIAAVVLVALLLGTRAAGRHRDRRLAEAARRALADAVRGSTVPPVSIHQASTAAGRDADGQPLPGEGLDLVARPRRGPVIVGLVLLIVCWVLGFGGAIGLAVRAEWLDAGSAAATLALALAAGAVWLAGFAALALYAVAGAHRFAFHDRSVSVVTWRGRQRYDWADARSASLSTYRHSVSLVLRFGGLRVVAVPLDDFERPEALLRAIERRLRVGVAGADRYRQTPEGAHLRVR